MSMGAMSGRLTRLEAQARARAAEPGEPTDEERALPPHLRRLLAETGRLDSATLPPHLRALLDAEG